VLDVGRTLADYAVGTDTTVALSLRLRGGKGGFGSILRSSGKLKIVENIDACRDLQGRRIRCVGRAGRRAAT
jgi:hypothetical protein